MKTKALFLDKDNTIIRDIPYNVNPEKITLCEGVGETLRYLQQQGYKCIVITNQSGVGKGFFTEDKLTGVKERLASLLGIWGVRLDAFYYCPHDERSRCECRKPKPGMIEKAAKEQSIDIAESWMIGDILNDIEAGNRAGCKTIHIDNGGETEWYITQSRIPHARVRKFHQIINVIENTYGKYYIA